MPLTPPSNPDQFRRLCEIMDALLSPEGCPWDREQDHRTLRPFVVEEAYEVVDAIDAGDDEEFASELGDLGLQIVFHSALAKRRGGFDVDGVYRRICEKLIRRHPHVFADVQADDSGTVLKNWEAIKRQERAGKQEKPPSALDGVPRALPALQRADRLQDKARRVNFDWARIEDVFAKVREEIDELEEAHAEGNKAHLEEEFGDLLFALVNLSRFMKIDSERALEATSAKFTRRFQRIEEILRERGESPSDKNVDELEELWSQAKREERAGAKE